jgi:hypothetical protein
MVITPLLFSLPTFKYFYLSTKIQFYQVIQEMKNVLIAVRN